MKRLKRVYNNETYYLKGFTPLGVEYTTEKTKALRVKDNDLECLLSTLKGIECSEGYFTLEGCRNNSKASLFDSDGVDAPNGSFISLEVMEKLYDEWMEKYDFITVIRCPKTLAKVVHKALGVSLDPKGVEWFFNKYFQKVGYQGEQDVIAVFDKFAYIENNYIINGATKIYPNTDGDILNEVYTFFRDWGCLKIDIDTIQFYNDINKLLKSGYKIPKQTKHKEKQLELFV